MVPEPRKIERVIRETRDTFTLEFDYTDRPEGFPFAPGQFNMLYLFGVGEVPVSISGDPAEPQKLVHTIRAVGSVTRPMTLLKRGDTVGVRGPYGSAWPLEQAKGQDVVVMAGGIGLAPLRPVIHQLLTRREEFGRVVILYGTRTPEDVLYRKQLERWRGRFDMMVRVAVDRGGHTWRGHVGVVTSLLPMVRFDPIDTVAMLCGPEVMMRFAIRDLQGRGLADDKIHLSMERNMKCGVGFCGHCQYGPTFVCKEGPVFRYDRVEKLFALREI